MLDTIIIKALAGTKSRWVSQSQQANMKLSDWIVKNVEASMSRQIKDRLIIPADLPFADLKLTRDAQTGHLKFDWAPIDRICAASGLDVRLFRDQPEDKIADVLSEWYTRHRAIGGQPDPIMEALVAQNENTGLSRS